MPSTSAGIAKIQDPKPVVDINRPLDFGFTAVDESEIQDAHTEKKSELTIAVERYKHAEKRADDYQSKLDDLQKIFNAMLNKLAENPEKEYIKWPQRKESIAKIRAEITTILVKG